MKVEVRADRVIIDGYVNAVDRESRVLFDSRGRFIEKIMPNAFKRALEDTESVDFLLDHDKNHVIGNSLQEDAELYEDNIGLRAHLETSDEIVVKKAHEGKLRGWSFGFINTGGTEGFVVGKDGIEKRAIKSLKLTEVSLIDDRMRPCYQATSVELRGEEVDIVETRAFDFDKVEIIKEEKAIDYSKYQNILKKIGGKTNE